MGFPTLQALIAHLMDLQIIIQIVSLKISILSGYILQLKSGLQTKLRDDIKDAVVDILKRETREDDYTK
jgi:hypothetical protein